MGGGRVVDTLPGFPRPARAGDIPRPSNQFSNRQCMPIRNRCNLLKVNGRAHV
jgi:hypothetical protein